jgi:hypothetical protein
MQNTSADMTKTIFESTIKSLELLNMGFFEVVKSSEDIKMAKNIYEKSLQSANALKMSVSKELVEKFDAIAKDVKTKIDSYRESHEGS